MKCPECKKGKTKVLYSYLSAGRTSWSPERATPQHKNRTRECLECGHKFRTSEYVTSDIGKQEVIDRNWDNSFRRLLNHICFLYPFEREKISEQLRRWADMEKNPELRKKLYGKHADKF